MMDFNAVLAGLSAAAYVEGKDPAFDIVDLPPGVARLPGPLGHTPHSDSGFEASAFLYDGKIVISYAGTSDWRDGMADVAEWVGGEKFRDRGGRSLALARRPGQVVLRGRAGAAVVRRGLWMRADFEE